jgi:hypothetical protein
VASVRIAKPFAATSFAPVPTVSNVPATNSRCPSDASARTVANSAPLCTWTPPATAIQPVPSQRARRGEFTLPPATVNSPPTNTSSPTTAIA